MTSDVEATIEAMKKAFEAWLNSPDREFEGLTRSWRSVFDAGWQAHAAYEASGVERYRKALEAAMQLIEHGDFKNGVTDSTGSIDEGEVRASEIYHEIRALLDPAERALREEAARDQ